MACLEITEAIQWLQSGGAEEQHPVTAYFTKHFGYGGQYTAHKDSVHYAVGDVGLNNQPSSPHGHAQVLYERRCRRRNEF